MKYSSNKMRGFSLVELMVGMAIGLFILAGVFTVYVNGRTSQAVNDDQVAMVDDARFALQTISEDLRQSGLWGRVNEFDTLSYAAGDDTVKRLEVAVNGECKADWADYGAPVDAFNGNSPYVGSCTPDYDAGPIVGLASDVLELRYTLGQPVGDAALRADLIYLQSDVNQAAVFKGNVAPDVSVASKNMNFPLVVHAYYIASWSNVAGDGVPSLHRVSLEPGPVVQDQMLLAGVENMQIQYGIDTDEDGAVNSYVEPGDPLVDNWQKIRSVQIWLVIRSQRLDTAIDTSRASVIAGALWAFPNDGWRRQVVSTVVNLRNSKNTLGI